MPRTATHRPRNVGAAQAAAILYGDWGTSKAYVLGLAFALAGYTSFWLIAAVCILMALVGINYIYICKYSPFGGGAYASAKKRSDILALIAAFFLIADYLITAALSSLSCFLYLGVAYPEIWAIGAILAIGIINYFGPRHTGNLALIIGLLAFAVVTALSVASIPFFKQAIHAIQRPNPGFLTNWDNFVGIIVALSGIESIANATGVMKLNPGNTGEHPSVSQTSTRAILYVMIEVCLFTAFLGFMMNALPGLQVTNGEVNAPDQPNIRDYMLRYMGNFFVSQELNPMWGSAFGAIVGGVFAFLLLSAVSTAIVALVSLLFVMSRDGELPESLQKLTPFGVPIFPLIIATLVPVIVLTFVHDIAQLANLYAVGFVGAIATNLGASASDKTIPLTRFQRRLMWGTCVLMILIELTLFITKPDARRFALTVLTAGLILRAFVMERRQKKWASRKIKLRHAPLHEDETPLLHFGAILCAVRTIGKTLNFALQEAKRYEQPLYILYIKEQKVITDEDVNQSWLENETACQIFDYAKESSHEMKIKFFYVVSDSPADTIVNMAKRLRVSRVILGRPRQSVIIQMLRGNVIQETSEMLPKEIDLLVIS